MADAQQPNLGHPICALNGHSDHVEEANAQMARAAPERPVVHRRFPPGS